MELRSPESFWLLKNGIPIATLLQENIDATSP